MVTTYHPKSLKDYRFTNEDKLFLDANIWISIYGPQGRKRSEKKREIYQNALRYISESGGQIYIDLLVLSEFINRYSRFKYDYQKNKKDGINDFKVFRNNENFKSIAKAITHSVNGIMKRCTLIESKSQSLNMNNLINEYSRGSSDFNDQIITEICKSNDLILITDDGDFKTTEIQVLTENKNLLQNELE